MKFIVLDVVGAFVLSSRARHVALHVQKGRQRNGIETTDPIHT